MKPPKEEPAPAPRQLSMALDSVKLRGMTSRERGVVLALMARLLLEAAGVVMGEEGNDDRV